MKQGNDNDIVDLPPIQLQQAPDNIFEGTVELPSGGMLIDENSSAHKLEVLFNKKFSSISTVTAFLEFENNLWGGGEIYRIHRFGGQLNKGKTERKLATIQQINCDRLQQFFHGSFEFHILAESGSMHLKSIRFELAGHEL